MTFVSKNNLPNYGDQEFSAKILPEGIPAIKKLGLFLKEIESDINLTSPYNRCLETVEIIAAIAGKNFHKDERLGEFRSGLESFGELSSRIISFVDDLKSNEYKNVSVCSHGYPISAMIQYVSSGKIEKKQLLTYPDPGVLSIFKDGKLTQIDFNK
jgi:broad specificity phosphatase PhoE